MKVLLILGFVGTAFLIVLGLVSVFGPEPVEADAVERLWRLSAAEETASAKAFDSKIEALRKSIKSSDNSAKVINMTEEVKRLKKEKHEAFQQIRGRFEAQKAAIYKEKK